MWYLCVCSVGAICGLHREVVVRPLLSIQRFGDDNGSHSLLYVKHIVTVPTCSTRGRSDRRREKHSVTQRQSHRYTLNPHQLWWMNIHTQTRQFSSWTNCSVMSWYEVLSNLQGSHRLNSTWLDTAAHTSVIGLVSWGRGRDGCWHG